MIPFTFKFELASTDYNIPLGFRVLVDGTEQWATQHIKQPETVSIEIPDSDEEILHELKLELSGKELDHTTIDDQGQIVSDVLVTVSNITLDDIRIDYPVYCNSEYYHDFNGTQAETTDKFYGTLGCNGSVIFKFSTPIFLWLLDHS